MPDLPRPRDLRSGARERHGKEFTEAFEIAAFEAVFGQSAMGLFLVRHRNSNCSGSTSDSPGSTASPSRSTAAARRTTSCPGSRPTGCRPRCARCWRPATRCSTCRSSAAARSPRAGAATRSRCTGCTSSRHRPIGIAGLATDVTSRQRAEREAAHARRNLALLNEAGARIGNSLDLETTARELLDVAVPHFCDLASVDLYQALLSRRRGPGRLRPTAARAAPGRLRQRRLRRTGRSLGGRVSRPVVSDVHRYPFGSTAARALRTAQRSPGSRPPRSGRRTGQDAGPRGSVVQSTLVVPMVARDTVLGLVQFSRAKGSEPFGERDIALADELVARAAVCIDNARLYRREHERALILQRSLLPPGDPEAAGLDIACRYLPGNSGDRGRRRLVRRHRAAGPPHRAGRRRRDGPRPAGRRRDGRTAHRGADAGAARPGAGRGAQRRWTRSPAGLADPSAGRTRRAAEPRRRDLAEVYLATCVYAVYDAVTRRCHHRQRRAPAAGRRASRASRR